MNTRWDLSFLYAQGFEDPAFAEDLARVPVLIGEGREMLRSAALTPLQKLEGFVDGSERLSALAERLGDFIGLTLAVDAENETAARYQDQLDVLYNEMALLQSEAVRFVGHLEDLDALIAASPKLQTVAFALREMAEQEKHAIPEEIEPWILEMQRSGGNAFSLLRDRLDSTHTVPFRGEELPLSAVRGKAYDADPAVRREAWEAELAAYRKIELPMSFCLNSIKQEARTLVKARGFASVLDMTLQDSRMDAETLDAMWTAIREFLPDFRILPFQPIRFCLPR